MSEPKRTSKERAADFIGALRRARNDRGKLAALRRGLTNNPRMHVDAWPVVAALGGDIGQPLFVAIAALFASHPDESNARNLGETCRRISQGDGKEIAESFERRFRRLLACGEVADVTEQLRSWVRLAASKGVGVNYESLFADLWNWPWYADEIRVKWARAFWQSGETSVETQPATATTK
jgi:CRISPR type I-E-associated protein CasB/Cse2